MSRMSIGRSVLNLPAKTSISARCIPLAMQTFVAGQSEQRTYLRSASAQIADSIANDPAKEIPRLRNRNGPIMAQSAETMKDLIARAYAAMCLQKKDSKPRRNDPFKDSASRNRELTPGCLDLHELKGNSMGRLHPHAVLPVTLHNSVDDYGTPIPIGPGARFAASSFSVPILSFFLIGVKVEKGHC